MTLDELAVKIGELQEKGFGELEVQTFNEDERVFVGCYMVAPVYASTAPLTVVHPKWHRMPERISFFWSWDDV